MPAAEAALMTMFFSFMGASIMAAIFGIMFMLFLLLTPANVFLKGKLRKKPIIAARRRDRRIDFHLADSYSEGMVTSKKYGTFIVDPDSVYMDKKTGCAILPVNSEVGITLNPNVLQMIDGLKNMGLDNIEEAEIKNATWGDCTCGYTGAMLALKNPKDSDSYFLGCPKDPQLKEAIAHEEKTTETPGNEVGLPDQDDNADVQLR